MPLLVRKHGDISMQVVAAGCIGLGGSDSWFRSGQVFRNEGSDSLRTGHPELGA